MDVSRREKSSMMNKMIKKLSAVAIAAAMTLSTGVAAQAATLKVYFREWHQGTTSNTPSPLSWRSVFLTAAP